MVSITPIANLPAAVSLNGNEEIPAVQAGTGVRISVSQIIDLVVQISLLNLFSEQLTVSAPNTINNLSMVPASAFSMLIINGQVFMPGGSSPAYIITGQAITWLSGIYEVQTTDVVYAVYLVAT